jgi:glycosyltransferase involved in cell wall biosynthesis
MNVLHFGLKEWPYISGEMEGKNRGGGTGKYCDLLFRSMRNMGVNIFIVTRRFKHQSRYEKKGNITVYRYKTFAGRRLRHVSLAFITFFTAFFLIRKRNIDIIQSHMLISNIPAIIIGKIMRKPVIIVPHGAMFHKYLPAFNNSRRKIERFIEKKLYPLATKTIMFCQYDIDMYKKLSGKDIGNMYIIPTGFEIRDVKMPKFDFASRKIKLLFVGRLLKLKKVDNLIKAISLLDKESQNKICLDIVGEGEELNRLKEMVNTLGLKNTISFHGFIQDPKSYYLNTDIFCLISDTEGQSLALMEAMANYSACLINDFGVPFSENSVITIENNEPKTVSKEIENLVNNLNLIKNLAINGRNEIKNNYSVDAFSKKYVTLYNSILE